MRRDSGCFPYARGMQEGKLTWLWTRASAGLLLGWTLVGVVHRELASRWRSPELAAITTDDDWMALAFEADGPGSASGSGSSPEHALANLAEELRRMRGIGTDSGGF